MESLNAIRKENLITNIMYEVRTTYPKIKQILKELSTLDLIIFKDKRGTGPGTDAGQYSLTEKGKSLLNMWYDVSRAMTGG